MRATTPKLAAVFFDQIIRVDCYGIRDFVNGLGLRSLPPDPRSIRVIDIGANVGYFSVLARMLLPYSKIYAVEPCADTLPVLNENTANLDIYIIPSALGPSGTTVTCCHGRDSGSNYTVASGSGVQITCFSLAELMNKGLGTSVTVIKSDCEGGEQSIIESEGETAALLCADHVAMELHWQCEKWPQAISKGKGMQWVDRVKALWVDTYGAVSSASYKDTGRGGILVMSR
jgi:FkbM family methyltransferase